MSMLAKFTKSLIWIFSIIIVLCLCAFFTIQSQWFWNVGLVKILNANVDDLVVESIKIERKDISFPNRVHFKNVAFDLTHKLNSYQGNIRDIDLNISTAGLVIIEKYALDLKGVTLESKDLQLEGGHLFWEGRPQSLSLEEPQGSLAIDALRVLSYEFQNMQTKIIFGEKKIFLEPFVSQFYKGELSGKIIVDYPPKLTYSIELKLKDVDLDELQATNQAIFSQVTGLVEGDLLVSGDEHQLRVVQADLNIPSKAMMKASLLSYILQYIPASEQKTKLEALIQSGGRVTVDDAQVTIKNLSSQTLEAGFNLDLKELNLNPQVTIELNVEGGFKNLLFYLKKLSPQT